MTDRDRIIREIVRALQPSMGEWEIADVGEVRIDLPPHEETLDERVAAGHCDGYVHYRAGDDAYITIGTIHLKRPVEITDI